MSEPMGTAARICEASQRLINLLMESGARQGVPHYELERTAAGFSRVIANATCAERLALWDAYTAYCQSKREFEEEER